ncbi:extracellular solute-binding protein family 5 [Syntrophobotulus glycolicus DSM 8271]|uniref:Extracellular solute-binding protein family 5 n=2 Tax=Syntrophobotulus TaxID=51196 RepID=F0SVS1_SYNGF|nr:extracellular solute-binding protein family 5 [Syntrophobotulus glycolicus DSM 8271]
MKKRMITWLLLFAFVFVGGCAGQGPAASGGGNKDGIVVSVGTTIFDESLDPIKGGMSYGYAFTNSALLRVNSDSEYEGDMATQWTVSDDALVYTFKLRDGVKFSDGSEFNADDVVFTFDTVKANQANNANVDLTKLASAKKTDDSTVVFTLSEPYSPFLDTVATLGIVPSDGYDSAAFDQKPVGTGPWKVVQYDANQQIIVEPNEHYYEGPPSIKKVTLVYMDAEAALAAAKSGQLDIVMVGANYASETVSGMHIQPFETMDIRMVSLPVGSKRVVKNAEGADVTVGNAVTSDINVRKALAIGIDRKAIIQDAFNGVGKPANGFTGNLVWANQETYTDNRKDEAAKVLESAGWVDTDGNGVREKNGVPCQFTVYAPGSDNDRFLLASAVAEDAAKFGVKIDVKTATWDEVGTLQYTNGIVWGWGQYNPTVIYSLFHSSSFLNGYNNVVGYHNSTADASMAKALSANSQAGAIAAWKQAQATANADYPYLYLVNIEHCYFVSDSLDVSLGTQIAHPHGHGSPIICNMKDWTLK